MSPEYAALLVPAGPSTPGAIQLAGDLSGPPSAPTVPALVPDQLGTLTVIGHSYTCGSSLFDSGASNVWQESCISGLQGLMKVHEQNVLHLGQAGSILAGTVNPITNALLAGWAGVAQFVVPNNQVNVNAASDPTTYYSHAMLAGGAGVVVHGHNDFASGYNPGITNIAAIQPAYANTPWKNALRFILSRLRANNLFSSTITGGTGTTISWDPSIAFGGTGGSHWSDVPSVTQNTGPAYKKSTTNGDTVTITIPPELAGSELAVAFVGQPNQLTYLAGNITAAATALTVHSATGFPSAGNFVILIDAEQMLVTAGQGTTAWTVTRGFNGTVAAAHNTPAAVLMAPNMVVNFAGTASGTGGSITLGAAGLNGNPTIVIKRFTTTAADAGATIIATCSGIPAGDTSSFFQFDSWHSEAPFPLPVAVTNLQHFNINAAGSTATLSLVAAFNAATASVIAEFDSWVQEVDLYTLWWNNNGTITANINNTDASTTVGWTANSASYTPAVGDVMSFGGFNAEHCLVTAVAGAAPNWTLTLQRGYDAGNKYAQTAGTYLFPMKWMSRHDDLHPSPEGHKVIANALYGAFKAMPAPSSSQRYALIDGNWSQYAQSFSSGPRDNYWYRVPASSTAAGIPPANKAYYYPIYITKTCILVGMGVIVTTGTTTTPRFGVFFTDATREAPGRLLQDFGAVALPGTAPYIASVTGLYQILRPGWYWLCVVAQAGGATMRCIGNAANNGGISLGINAIPAAATTVVPIAYAQAGVAGALADTSYLLASPTTDATVPQLWYQLRAVQFG